MFKLEIAGHRAHVDEQGEGPPVVLLHSGGLSGGQWRRLTESLRASYRVLVPDFLGMGQSAPWPAGAPFHFNLDVDLAEAVLARAGGPAHVIGHSYGGLIALHLARRAPGQIRSLGLCEPVVFSVLPPGDEGRAEVDRVVAEGMPEDAALGGTEPWLRGFIDYWSGAGAWSRLPPTQREAFVRVGGKLYLEVASLEGDTTPASAFAAVTAPTLLLSGSASTRAANRVCEVLAEAMPHVQHEVLPGATHMAPLVEAQRGNATVLRHLAGVDATEGVRPS